MTTQAQTSAQPKTQNTSLNLLKLFLYENSAFSFIMGFLMLGFPTTVAGWMGTESHIIFTVLGILLIVWALDVLWVARQNPIKLLFVRLIIGADVLWVVGSALILAFNLFDFSATGNWTVLIVADIVMIFAIGQYAGIRRYKN